MNLNPVEVECVAVPDGVIGNADARKLRLSLVLRPVIGTREDSPGLLDWPRHVAGLGFEITFRSADGSRSQVVSAHRADIGDPGSADELWKAIWSEPALQNAYHGMLRRPDPSQVSAAPVEKNSYANLAELANFRTQVEVMIGLTAAVGGAALKADGSFDPVAGLDAADSVLAMRRFRDPNDPLVRLADAKELVARDAFANLAIGDDLDRAAAVSSPPDGEGVFGTPPPRARTAGEAGPRPAESAALRPLVAPLAGSFTMQQFARPMAHSMFGHAPPAPAPGGPAGTTETPAPSPVKTALDEFDRAFAPDAGPARAATEQEETIERVQRRLAGLQAHPTARKFLRLIVDVEVDPAALGALYEIGRFRGTVSATVVNRPAPDRPTRTALVMDLSSPRFPLFEPCPEAEFGGQNDDPLVPSLPLRDGVIRLNSGGRFRLESIDAIAATLSLRSHLTTAIGGERSGAALHEIPLEVPGVRTRGLSLIDTEADKTVLGAERRAAAHAAAASGQPTILYAEDLVEGYRLDVVASDDSTHSAGVRDLSYREIPPAPLARHPFPGFEDRDEGYVATPVRSRREKSGPDTLVASECLFTWTGNNIGLPNPNRLAPEHQFPEPLVAEKPDLPLSIGYAFKPGHQGPILRFNRRYRFLLRARKINGGSVSREFASTMVADHAVGSPTDPQGYSYTISDRSPAPDILIPTNDPATNVGTSTPEESATDLIVRDDRVGVHQPRVVRALLSPRIDAETAEQTGIFDGDEGADMQRYGVYRRIYLEDETGRYPTFRRSGPDDGQRFFGHLLRLQSNGPWNRANPFYADKTVRHVGTRLKATKATPPTAIEETPSEEVSFWSGERFDDNSLKPIKLEVVARTLGKSRLVTGGETLLGDGNRTIPAPTIRVEVAPADTLELEVWTARDGATSLAFRLAARAALPAPAAVFAPLAGRRGPGLAVSAAPAVAVAATLSRFADLTQNLGSANFAELNQLWAGIVRTTRIGGLHAVTRFRIEHHVPKPLATPAFGTIFAVVRARDDASWERLSAAGERRGELGAQRAFVLGSVAFHRKSTGTLRCECAWRDFSAASAIVRTTTPEDPDALDQAGLWRHEPRLQHGDLWPAIENIPALSPGGVDPARYESLANQFNLVRDETGALRRLAAPFQDTIARRVAARLIAKTRFPGSYPTALEDQLLEVSADRSALANELLRPSGEDPPGVKTFWLYSTTRPPKPALTNPSAPVYRRIFRPLTSLPQGHRGKQLVHQRRIWLGRDWNASGEGEQLAILCRHPSRTDDDHPTDFEWLNQQLSRIGADMTLRAARPLAKQLLGASQIVSPNAARNLIMPMPAAAASRATATAGARQVQAALLTPNFHDGRGEWYCDIELAEIGPFRTWLKLGLARYQEHSIPECILSEAVVADPFLLPQPWSFSAGRVGQEIVVTVTGPSYVERAPMVRGLPNAADAQVQVFDMAQLPLITAELERLDANGASPLPVGGLNGQPLTVDSRGRAPEVLADGQSRWRLPLPVSPGLQGRHAVRVTLSSAHANSDALYHSDAEPLLFLPEPISCQLKLA